jgi:prepilin-type N-terminal cleavage/methylation domain-containing protein/prepilin-type processing-associated H-X9-DG protein
MKGRHAMTLIETLVVVAIIGILLGLVLPGIQNVRESANRVQCANQLRQIALACHGYHNVSGAFPPGYVACDSTDPLETNPGWGWASHLLPFLDQNAVFQDIVFHEPIEAPANQARLREIKIYLCPSDAAVPPSFVISDANGQLVTEAAPSSYAACYGIGELDEVPGPKEGVFYRNSHVRLGQITDGTSTTLLIGDRFWSHAMAPWAGAVNHGIVRGGPRNAWRNSPEAAYPSPNFACVQANALNAVNDPDGALDEFFSEHPGGCNIAFADAAVHFLHQQINRAVLMALGTRAGGEVVAETDY